MNSEKGIPLQTWEEQDDTRAIQHGCAHDDATSTATSIVEDQGTRTGDEEAATEGMTQPGAVHVEGIGSDRTDSQTYHDNVDANQRNHDTSTTTIADNNGDSILLEATLVANDSDEEEREDVSERIRRQVEHALRNAPVAQVAAEEPNGNAGEPAALSHKRQNRNRLIIIGAILILITIIGVVFGAQATMKKETNEFIQPTPSPPVSIQEPTASPTIIQNPTVSPTAAPTLSPVASTIAPTLFPPLGSPSVSLESSERTVSLGSTYTSPMFTVPDRTILVFFSVTSIPGDDEYELCIITDSQRSCTGDPGNHSPGTLTKSVSNLPPRSTVRYALKCLNDSPAFLPAGGGDCDFAITETMELQCQVGGNVADDGCVCRTFDSESGSCLS